MTISYTVTVTDWSQRRGYRQSGRGWRVRCFGIPDDDWNTLATTFYESFEASEAEARRVAARLAQEYGAHYDAGAKAA